MPTVAELAPPDAAALAAELAKGRRVQPVGGGTKLDWGTPGEPPELLISTGRLDAIVEHNEGDLTAIVQAGVPLRTAQERFGEFGQRLSLDPPDDGRATIGGILATGDSGPLRHRHGGPRDLILGVRIALPDGTVARAGSNVIKNVAGYDLAKLMCGAFGTLGVICEATVRLHPLPASMVTVAGRGMDPSVISGAGRLLARSALELEALDLRWDGPDAGGCVLARTESASTAEAVRALLHETETELHEDDEAIWAEQRARQRPVEGGAVVRVSTVPTDIERVFAASSSAIVRVALGLAWVRLPGDDPDAVRGLRSALAPAPCVLQGAPAALRGAVDPWDVGEGPELELLRRVKARFDPAGVLNRGRFAGGI